MQSNGAVAARTCTLLAMALLTLATIKAELTLTKAVLTMATRTCALLPWPLSLRSGDVALRKATTWLGLGVRVRG